MLKVGDRVKSQFRTRWSGEVVEVQEREGVSPLITVLVDTDMCGRPMRKKLTCTLDADWLKSL